jgi:hypothetical protein
MFDVTISSNFDDFEKEIVKDLADEIKNDLRRAGVSEVKVTISGSLDNLQLNLDGPDDQIEKATRALDLD